MTLLLFVFVATILPPFDDQELPMRNFIDRTLTARALPSPTPTNRNFLTKLDGFCRNLDDLGDALTYIRSFAPKMGGFPKKDISKYRVPKTDRFNVIHVRAATMQMSRSIQCDEMVHLIPGTTEEKAWLTKFLCLIAIEESGGRTIASLTYYPGSGRGLAEIGIIQMSTIDSRAPRYGELLLQPQWAGALFYEVWVNALSTHKVWNDIDPLLRPLAAYSYYANGADSSLKMIAEYTPKGVESITPDYVRAILERTNGRYTGRSRFIKYMSNLYPILLDGRDWLPDQIWEYSQSVNSNRTSSKPMPTQNRTSKETVVPPTTVGALEQVIDTISGLTGRPDK